MPQPIVYPESRSGMFPIHNPKVASNRRIYFCPERNASIIQTRFPPLEEGGTEIVSEVILYYDPGISTGSNN